MARRRKPLEGGKRPLPPQCRAKLLSADQEAAIREALLGGATRDEAAAVGGITRRMLDTRLNDQLRDVRVGQGRRRGRPKDDWPPDPTPEEIAARAAECRRTWGPERFGIGRQFSIDDLEALGRAASPHGVSDADD